MNLIGEGLDTSVFIENLEFIDSAVLRDVSKTNSGENSRKLRRNSTKNSIFLSHELATFEA